MRAPPIAPPVATPVPTPVATRTLTTPGDETHIGHDNGDFLLNGQRITAVRLGELAREEHQRGDLSKAALFYEALLAHDATNSSALHGLALIALSENGLQRALDFLNRALYIAPTNPVLYYDRGVVFQNQGEHQTAVKNYDLAIFLKNDYALAYSNKGIALESINQTALALQNYELALCAEPAFASAWYNRGNLYKANQILDTAVRCYTIAIGINPNFWQALTNLGLSYYGLKLFEQALEAYDRAILINPNFAVIHYNRANVLRTLGDTAQALQSYAQAVQINPSFAPAFANRGLVRKDLNQLDIAAADYQVALDLDPGLLEAKWNFAIVQLMRGEWTKAWADYELRFEHSDLRQSVGVREFNVPRLSELDLQKDLHGKRVLIYCEQGLGDSIQFSRYLPLLKSLGAYVILEIQAVLHNLFKDLDGIDELVIKGHESAELPPFDYFCPLLSLPKVFQTTPSSVPPATRFHISKVDKFDDRLEFFRTWTQERSSNHTLNGTKKIGLVWQGNLNHSNDHNRSLPLKTLLVHLPTGFDYFVIQKEISASDLDLLKEFDHVHTIRGELVDLVDTAVLCLQLDLIISVDTSVAHLSGSLGKPTWVMLPFSPDWRWLMKRQDTPWYLNMRLFRQQSPGDWSSTLEEVKTALTGAIK
jgi:hypothetical protein